MEPIELTEQTNGQVHSRAFHFKVKTSNEEFIISVLASSCSIAKEELKKQYQANSIFSYLGTSSKILHVQGVIDVHS